MLHSNITMPDGEDRDELFEELFPVDDRDFWESLTNQMRAYVDNQEDDLEGVV